MIRGLICIAIALLAHKAHAEDPPWLKDARAKEAAKISSREIRSTDGWFRARVPANLVGKIELAQGSYSVQLDVGAPTFMNCEVFPEGLDLANGLKRIFDNIIAQAGEQQKVEAHALDSVDAGNWDDVAWIQANWMYRVFNGKDRLLGGARQYGFDKNGVGVYCGVSEFGYSGTTREVVKALANTLTFDKPVKPSYFTEILVWSANGMNIGVTTTRLERDADGDTLNSADVALMFPVNGAAHSTDGSRREWSRPDGSLINAVDIVTENGNMTGNLRLDEKDGGWVISGKSKGKDMGTVLPANAQPGSRMGLALALRKLVAREKPSGAEHRMWLWEGGDLMSLNESVTRITGAAEGKFTADYRLGPDTSKVWMDSAGAVTSMKMPVGGMTLEMRRIYTSGSF